MKKCKKGISFLLLVVLFTVLGNTSPISNAATHASAVEEAYPLQEMNLVTKQGTYLQQDPATGLSVAKKNSSSNQNWKFIYVKENVFKIVNSNNNKAVTLSGTSVTLSTDTDKDSQYWTITELEQDVLGNVLTYKITNTKNANLALTFTDGKQLQAQPYTGDNNQKWLLNSAGLQGFAGYSIDMDGKEKASTIGGVLGKTVYVSSLSQFEAYAAGDTPTTIVITKDILVDVPAGYTHQDSDEKLLTKIKVGKNKTIIGAYGVTLRNVYFYLDKYSDSGNFILKNVTLQHSEELDLNNFIPLYISQGENFWIDHVTFEGHDSYSSEHGTIQDIHQKGIDEDTHAVDKFVYVGVKADYVTLSDSKFTNHEYGLILGYPNENSEETMNTYTGYPRMTMSGNYFTRMYCRAPGLMRYGYFHTFNNYVEDAHLAYTLYTRATVFSESNYFTSVKGILDDKVCAGFTDVGSYPEVTAKKSPAASWLPSTNYSYQAMTAQEAKEFCMKYSGAQDSSDSFVYIEDLFSTTIDKGPADDVVTDDSTVEEPEEDNSSKEESPAIASKIHNFTTDSKISEFFTITGSLSSSKGSVAYNGLTLKQCLKMESSTSVKFTTTASAKITLVFNSAFNKDVLIDGVEYTAQNGVLTATLAPGSHSITKSDVSNLYYIQLDY